MTSCPIFELALSYRLALLMPLTLAGPCCFAFVWVRLRPTGMLFSMYTTSSVGASARLHCHPARGNRCLHVALGVQLLDAHTCYGAAATKRKATHEGKGNARYCESRHSGEEDLGGYSSLAVGSEGCLRHTGRQR